MINASLPTVLPAHGHIHIVGIGGAGMSAIARVLLGRGYIVSGSDQQTNAITDALAHDGATIYAGHAASNMLGAALILISSAIPSDNPEVVGANAAGIPVLKRREALGALTDGYDVIAVAGTHGKTTTTALITHLLIATGHEPTYIVGGTMLNTGTNAGVGKSKWFVIEADEYDAMFLGLHPKIAVITNIEHDHPDMFPSLDDVLNAFRQFVGNIRDDGILFFCGRDSNAALIAAERQNAGKAVVSYGLNQTAALERALSDAGFRSIGKSAEWLKSEHNRLNATGALRVAVETGSPYVKAFAALFDFKGVARRMEKLGETANGISVYSDYGHHPTAIRATLRGARTRFPEQVIWAVWQPHTYSRTHLLAHEFAQAFKDADHALITDIYAAREQPSPGPSEGDIVTWAHEAGHADVRHTGGLSATAATLRAEAKPGDVVIIFSAGDGPKIGELLLNGESHR
ncbi:MAG: UDP-N-acetylmuramate--L-alanine ligase [Aggregatilineales bacterium]